MKKVLCLILGLVLSLAFMTGCGDIKAPEGDTNVVNEPTAWEYIRNKGELIVGLDATFAPMGFTDEKGEIIGFDIDLAKEVGEILDIKIKFQPISWDAKEMELSSKRIDCIWNGMSITPERQENMALTQAYLNNKIVIMGKDADEIASLEDLKGKKIGTQAKSAALEVLQESDIYDAVKANVTEMPTYDEVILDMKTGRVNVMIVDEVLGEFKNSKLDAADKMKVAPVDFGDDLYAIGCRKGETDVVEKLEGAIKQAIKSGKAKEISEKWFGTDLVLDIK